jgi:hypothetical protein
MHDIFLGFDGTSLDKEMCFRQVIRCADRVLELGSRNRRDALGATREFLNKRAFIAKFIQSLIRPRCASKHLTELALCA